MRNFFALVLVAITASLVIGCAANGPSKIIGEWNTQVPDTGPATVTYAADGSMTMIGNFPQGGKDAKLVITGKWTADGDKVHMVYSDAKFTGLPAAVQSKEKTINDAAKKAIGMGTDNLMIVKFDGDNAFSSTDSKGTVSNFTRKTK